MQIFQTLNDWMMAHNYDTNIVGPVMLTAMFVTLAFIGINVHATKELHR